MKEHRLSVAQEEQERIWAGEAKTSTFVWLNLTEGDATHISAIHFLTRVPRYEILETRMGKHIGSVLWCGAPVKWNSKSARLFCENMDCNVFNSQLLWRESLAHYQESVEINRGYEQWRVLTWQNITLYHFLLAVFFYFCLIFWHWIWGELKVSKSGLSFLSGQLEENKNL